MVPWPGFLNHKYGFNDWRDFNPAKKDIFSLKNYEYIYYFGN